MSQVPIPPEREKAWMAIMLAWVAAFVDAVGYLTLLHIGISYLSGETVRLGVYLSEQQWRQALLLWSPIPLFVVGLILGSFTVEIVRRAGGRSSLAITLSLEFLLLSAFLVFGSALFRPSGFQVSATWQWFLLVGLITIPMGFQTTALQRIGGRVVRTTYITGMLADLAEAVTYYVLWLRDHMRQRPFRRKLLVLRLSRHQPSLRRIILTGGICLAFLVGAISGALAQLVWHLIALCVPLGVLALLIVLDLIWPTNPPSRDDHHELGPS